MTSVDAAENTDHEALVVGAGVAGVASALALKDRGIDATVLEKADEVASSWRRRYDRLRLNTWRGSSHLPDRRFPTGTPKFPTRDDILGHVQHHAAEARLDVRFGTEVERVDKAPGGWLVRASVGDRYAAAQLIVATGYEHLPFIPPWRGRDDFRGRLLHACEYRNPEPFRDRSVLVVGPGCSGMEIAYDLATGGAAKVSLSARTGPTITLREGPGGIPGDLVGAALMHLPTRIADAIARQGSRSEVGDLSEFGLAAPQEGLFTRLARTGQAPTIIDEEVLDAIRSRQFEIVPGVEALGPSEVELAGGRRLAPDAIICATGYRRGLEPLVGHLGVLDRGGRPTATGPDPAAPGLRFIGYVPRPGGIGYASKQAKRAARAIARELAASRKPLAA